MSQAPEKLRKLMQMIAQTRESELDCGEIFALLDRYAEAALAGEDLSTLYPQVIHHLELCPDCLEEYRALLELLQTLH